MDPPAVSPCLTRPYSSSPDQKGGTLIADVHDLEEHEERLAAPDAYRPEKCPTCGCTTLHAHDFRTRKFGAADEIQFRRYRCQGCLAAWMVLAAFVARWLHQRWDRVQRAVAGTDGTVPRRTVLRWLERLRSAALVLVQVLGEAAPELQLETSWSRGELVDHLADVGRVDAGRKLAALAAWIHRLSPGLRLM